LRDLDRVFNFIVNWTGLKHPLPSDVTLSSSIPEPLRRLDAQFGAFWGNPPYPLAPTNLDYNRKRGLFAVQDYIKDPRKQKSTSNGLVGLVSENQGVWHFSYDTRNHLYFEGDWVWGDIPSSIKPTAFPAEIEDVLCFALLVNFFAYVDGTDWQDIFSSEDIWPEDITVQIWNHAAWNNYKGFWTNKDGTALLFDGMGFLRRSNL